MWTRKAKFACLDENVKSKFDYLYMDLINTRFKLS